MVRIDLWMCTFHFNFFFTRIGPDIVNPSCEFVVWVRRNTKMIGNALVFLLYEVTPHFHSIRVVVHDRFIGEALVCFGRRGSVVSTDVFGNLELA